VIVPDAGVDAAIVSSGRDTAGGAAPAAGTLNMAPHFGHLATRPAYSAGTCSSVPHP
jgi:hypothetical protein